MSTKPPFQRGVSLVELIMFIVIISTALIGILAVMNQTSAHSADPLIRKQALAIAESLLEEVELMPFTFCDPDDVNAASAVSAASCSIGMDQDNANGTLGIIPAGAETRASTAAPFDNVADYAGMPMATATDILGTAYSGYAATVTMTREGAALLGGGVPAGAALRITVTVDGPGSTQVVLDGYRTRFSPRI
jgi:MSHA pilin protein MshD